jgi:hypothetical protein
MADSSGKIIFCGGIFRDLVAYADRFPKVGETLFGTKFKMGFGGKSANQVSVVDYVPKGFLILSLHTYKGWILFEIHISLEM